MYRPGYLFRQLVALSVIVCLPLVLLLAYNIGQSAAQARSSAYQAVTNYAESIGQEAESLLAETEQYLMFLSSRPLVLAVDSGRCDPVLEGVVGRRRHFANVLVTDTTGRPVCTSISGPGAVPDSFGATAWWRLASASPALSISKPYLAPIARKMVVAVSIPLQRPGQARIGTLSVLLDLDSFRRPWSRYVLPPGSRLSLLDRDGTLLVTQPDFDKLVGTDASAVLNAALLANPSGVGVARGIDGVERAFARKQLQASGWQVISAIPADSVFAGYHAQRERGLWVGLAVLAIVSALSVLISRRLAAPLVGIARTARAVGAGDLEARSDESAPGEFREVARELNAMLDARRQAEAAQRESERRFVDLLGNVEMISLMLDRDGRITYCNDFLLRMVGRTREEMLGTHWHTAFVPAGGLDLAALAAQSKDGSAVPRVYEGEIQVRGDGTRLVRWHNSVLRSRSADIEGIASLGEDVTETRDVAARERRQRDFYKALSRTNGAIVRMTTPAALYDEICAICVEHGHASIAYISLVEGNQVRPVAWAGGADDFVAGLQVTLDDTGSQERGPTAIAVRTGSRYVANDCETDPATAPWRERAAQLGTHAVAAFPFRRGGRVAGTLGMHMTVRGFFDQSLIDLVEEMTRDISFALDNFDRETARAQAEEQAESEGQRFRTLFQAAPVAITISSAADQRLLDVNDAQCEMGGKKRSELIGQNAFEAARWADTERRRTFEGALRAGGRVRNFELQIADESGAARDYLLQADLINFDGQDCVLTITNDITDLRSAERQLDVRERQLATLVDTAMDAIIAIDFEQRIRLYNRAAADIFEVPAAQAMGQRIERFIPPRLRAAHRGHVTAFAHTGSTGRRMGALHTLVGLRADGTEFPIEASISKVGDAADALMTVVVRDVSELRRAEEARLAQASAESASRAKTEFLSQMSHELRTPLNAVLGFSQLLESHPTDPLTPNQRVQVEQIRKAGWHLLALINDVLDVTKIEAGRIELDRRRVDVLEVLDEACRMTESLATSQRVAMFPEYRKVPSAFAWTDPVRLRQVVVNVVSNAIKYNHPGGAVSVYVLQDDARARIDVVDNGMGMSAEQLAHLYEPFNRLGRGGGTIEGTGLGLALTKQLVGLMGGEIHVTSDLGKGTTVQVTIPSRDDAAAARPLRPHAPATSAPTPSSHSAAGNPSGTVLYIEDNPVNVLLVEQLLSRWPNVTLLRAGTGEAGVALARSARPDVILLDMRLPDMDGAGVLAALGADEAMRGLRVIALSANAMPAEIAAATRAGAADYWTKPIDCERFLASMAQLLATA